MSYMVGFNEVILPRDPGQYESSILEFLTTQYTWDQNIYEVTYLEQVRNISQLAVMELPNSTNFTWMFKMSFFSS